MRPLTHDESFRPCSSPARQPPAILFVVQKLCVFEFRNPGRLTFADDEEKKIVMEGAATGAGLGIGLGLGLGGSRNSTIGLGTIGGLIGGAVGSKQAKDIRSLKLKSSELEDLVDAANRRIVETNRYNQTLRSSIAKNNAEATTATARLENQKALHNQAVASLTELDDRISYLHAARTKSKKGKASQELLVATSALSHERSELEQSVTELASNN